MVDSDKVLLSRKENKSRGKGQRDTAMKQTCGNHLQMMLPRRRGRRHPWNKQLQRMFILYPAEEPHFCIRHTNGLNILVSPDDVNSLTTLLTLVDICTALVVLADWCLQPCAYQVSASTSQFSGFRALQGKLHCTQTFRMLEKRILIG